VSRTTIAYWIATGLFSALFLFGGMNHLFRTEMMAESMGRLGYPAYVMTILGVAKLLGVAAILMPGPSLLREWAYAGFTFDLLGATASHAFVGDPLAETITPLVVLALGAASYLLRPASRKFPAEASRLDTAAQAAG
jgi:uncharacterized membrane protein